MKVYDGISGAPGISRGRIYFLTKNSSSEIEIGIEEAIEKAKEKLNKIYLKAKETTNTENAKIFEAYNMLLEDSAYISPIINSINSGIEPNKAIVEYTEKMSAVFENHKSEYMKQRADDIRYVGNLLIECLNGIEYNFDLPEDQKIILASEELSPADTIQMDKTNITGFVTVKGGATSHTVILAKSLGIPAIVGVNEINQLIDGKEAILDATNGKLIVDPDDDTQICYNNQISEERKLAEKANYMSKLEAKTLDGEKICVYGNIGGINDLTNEYIDTVDGIGLFRSEFLYSSTTLKPPVDVQVTSYKAVIDALSPKNVTIRTLDIGGDKQLDYMNMPEEENPFLGNRGIRLCLLNPEIFKEQLEAILISSVGKSVKILFPMITTVEEIEKAKEILNNVKKNLTTEYCKDVSVGIMIETPASAINAENLAKHCDFFSIGTNDLIQYVTAADRGNDYVSSLYTPYNPAVIKLIYHVIKSANDNNIEVSMCGDMASNRELSALLLGLGLRKFSVPLPLANIIKYTISKIDLKSAKKLATDVMKVDKESDIKKLVNEFNAELSF